MRRAVNATSLAKLRRNRAAAFLMVEAHRVDETLVTRSSQTCLSCSHAVEERYTLVFAPFRPIALMFDAFFVPPVLRPSDVERMRLFGVDEVLIPLSAVRTVTHDMHAGDRAMEESVEIANHLRAMLGVQNIRAHFADCVSPHEEPDRLWEDRWESLCARVEKGELSAMGELRIGEGSARALRILDRHLEFGKQTNTPVLVAWDSSLDSIWRKALLQRAQEYAPIWWWTRVPARRIQFLVQSGAGVIATIGGKGHTPEQLTNVIRELEPHHRILLGSSRGRGLNPFALAAVEIAAKEHANTPQVQEALYGSLFKVTGGELVG